MPSLKAAVLALALAPAQAAKTPEENDSMNRPARKIVSRTTRSSDATQAEAQQPRRPRLRLGRRLVFIGVYAPALFT